MTKIEEFITKAIDGLTDEEWNKLIIAVKNYSEFYAQKYLRSAIKNVKVKQESNEQQGYAPYFEYVVDKDSILNTKLPEHD